MKIVAVVCSYWSERRQNVYQIVGDLLEGERPPDKVIVWNNQPGSFLSVPGARTVNAGDNYECRAKYVAALLEPADAYLLMDDDTSVGPGTLRALEAQHEACLASDPGEFVTGYWGVVLAKRGDGSWTFADGALVGPATVRAPYRVDAFHGRGLYVSFGALVNMLALEREVRVGTRWQAGQGDDLLIGLANEGRSYVTPLAHGERWVDLSEGGVAMCHEPGYFAMRDEFLNDALAVRDRMRAD